MSEYPEHDRMAAINEQSQTIGLFLDSMPYRLCEVVCLHCGEVRPGHECCRNPNQQFVPVRKSIERVLAGYFGIDLDLIEREKRQMLATIRAGGHRG